MPSLKVPSRGSPPKRLHNDRSSEFRSRAVVTPYCRSLLVERAAGCRGAVSAVDNRSALELGRSQLASSPPAARAREAGRRTSRRRGTNQPGSAERIVSPASQQQLKPRRWTGTIDSLFCTTGVASAEQLGDAPVSAPTPVHSDSSEHRRRRLIRDSAVISYVGAHGSFHRRARTRSSAARHLPSPQETTLVFVLPEGHHEGDQSVYPG